ncbi:adenosine receptor A1-like [Stylophora pistillata]|uniref:adenosine receptor A1-like n=1 Tax=Stylophora pistillata TaxID=50429 RepID=UPI000C056688|nr:adenosine receptor A1-like [Stylophora pistillata]
MDFNSWNIFWKACFASLATLIVVGNVLTIWIFLKQRRHKRAFSLLISLAIADVLVGILAIPLFLKVMVSEGYAWYVISIDADVLTGTTSIYTLAVISLERMFAVGWPLRHRTINFHVYICAISMPWIIAVMFTTLMVFQQFDMIGRRKLSYIIPLICGIPLLTTCVANIVVWKKQQTPFRNQNHIKREVKLAKTLALITATSLLTWLPFQIMNILFELKVMANFHHMGLTVFIIKLLQFSNSFVNVIIYPFRIPEFKRTLFQILNFRVIPSSRSELDVSSMRVTNSTFPLSNVHQ